MNVTDAHRFTVGAFECFAVSDGYHAYDPSSFFVGVPEATVQSELAELGQTDGNATTPYTFLLARTGEHDVLVDTGAGFLMPTTGGLTSSLEQAGVPAETVDTVVITHAHPDHVGGMLDKNGDLVYPNARYFISRAEWDFWFSEDCHQTQPDLFIELARKALAAVESQVGIVDNEAAFVPGVKMIATPGHTPGHVAVAIHSDAQTLVFAADTALFPLHLRHPDWENQYDWDTRVADESRRAFAERAAKEGWLVMFQHFPPFPSLGRIEAEEGGWRWAPAH